MKTAKLIIGIISIVLFFIIMLQSCATGFVNAVESNNDSGGSAGLLVAILMLVAGIVGIVTRKSKGGGITAGVFYILAALLALPNSAVYKDLMVWGVASIGFGLLFIIGSLKMTSNKKAPPEKETQPE